MRFFVSILIAYFCSTVSSLCADLYRLDGDRYLEREIYTNVFSNFCVHYSFGGSLYPVHVVYNPRGEILWGEGLDDPINLKLVMVGCLPVELAHHVENVTREMGFDSYNSYIELRGCSGLQATQLERVYPVHVAQSVYDLENDINIRALFQSTCFFNRVFYYDLDGCYYQVRVLYNPHQYSLMATRNFVLEPGDPMNSYTVSWNNKYGIFIDKKAPQFLVDHLIDLSYASYWDFQFNFSIENGTYVEYQTTSYGVYTDRVTTYYLDTWFLYAQDFQQ